MILLYIYIGSTVNHDGGSDTYGFTVTTRSVKSDEGHISILVDWKVMCVIALIWQLTLTRLSDSGVVEAHSYVYVDSMRLKLLSIQYVAN